MSPEATNALEANPEIADLFDELALNAPEDRGAPEDLPVNTWVVVKTATKEQGGAGPCVRTNTTKEGVEFKKFNVGLMCVGGAAGVISQQHNNRMVYFDAPVAPWEGDKGIISGRLAGFFNALFACGVAEGEKNTEKRSAARWGATMAVLKKVQAASPAIDGVAVTLESYGGDKARYLVGLATAYLLENSKTLLIKTTQNKNKSTGEIYGVKVGSFEDFTAANVEKRKCGLLEGVEAPKAGGITF
jgi:hypothetical protein